MKIKVITPELKMGMYVSELDRPWVESPFLFQGFQISSPEEIEQLQSICKYVYVDTEKSPVDVATHLHPNNKTSSATASKKKRGRWRSLSDALFKHSDDKQKVKFNVELAKARKIRDKTRSFIDTALEDSRLGNSIDTKSAKDLVSSLAESILRNPDASVWLTHLKARDEYTAIHSLNVCVLSLTFGRALGLSKTQLNVLGLGALLHDLGKMRVPLEVLNKPGRLTDEEFKIMRSHPELGYELLLNDKSIPPDALDIVISHHERSNGKGYPRGIDGSEIRYFTRIVTIVDVYDAITSDRVYHDGMTPHDALKRMYDWSDENFDLELMQAFIRTIGIYPVGSVVEFVSGHVGIVVKLNETHKLKPLILLLMNSRKEMYPKRKLVNLASTSWDKIGAAPQIKRIADAKEYGVDVKAIINAESNFD